MDWHVMTHEFVTGKAMYQTRADSVNDRRHLEAALVRDVRNEGPAMPEPARDGGETACLFRHAGTSGWIVSQAPRRGRAASC